MELDVGELRDPVDGQEHDQLAVGVTQFATVDVDVADLVQTVRKLRDTKSAVRISRPTIAQSGENHENSLSARLCGVSHRVFARSAGSTLGHRRV